MYLYLLHVIVPSHTNHQLVGSQVKVIARTRKLEKTSHRKAHQQRRQDPSSECCQALVICSLQHAEDPRLHAEDATFASLRQASSASKPGSVACSAAAGFDLGRGSEEAAVPLVGGGDGGDGGDSRGGNGAGKFVDEADDEGGDDDTLLSMQQVLPKPAAIVWKGPFHGRKTILLAHLVRLIASMSLHALCWTSSLHLFEQL